MDRSNTSSNVRGLSLGAFVFGVLGAILFWWVPMGLVLSLAGLLIGFVDWTMARRRSLDFRLSIAAMIFCLAALGLDIVIVALGLQTVTFGALR